MEPTSSPSWMPRVSNARRPCIERYRDQSIGLADASIVVLAESLSPREPDSVTSFSARDRGVTVMVRITLRFSGGAQRRPLHAVVMRHFELPCTSAGGHARHVSSPAIAEPTATRIVAAIPPP